ncbi:MAG: DUF839 domain-containing protein [Candidatus Thiodiazotropha sp. (ex Ctena orbiculata)]|nr:DUF839 domain-containing protein [Candidatus Thiodiazotropha taylori]
MTPIIRRSLVSIAVASAFVSSATLAGTNTWFTPLTESAPVVAPNDIEELSMPWVTPAGINQKNLLSMREVEDSILSPGQSMVRVPHAGRNASMFDMIAYDPSGEYLFIPHETPWGAGLSRYDIENNFNQVIFQGDGAGINCLDFQPQEPRLPNDICPDWVNDYAAFDPSRFTPNGTVFLGEEWSGEGRIIEILNPMEAGERDAEYRELDSIANVAHEGINFSLQSKKTIYYIDEWRSGSIYKFVMRKKGDYTKGQTFVLSVDDFIPSGGVAADLYNEQASGVVRTGAATWIPLTDKHGNPLDGITDPFRNGPTNDPRTNVDTRGGRVAADDANGTPYGRPEDMEVGKLRNGNEVIYFTATSENIIYSVEMTGKKTAMVREFVNGDVTPKNDGFAPTAGMLNSPDNLAQDALGNIYIIEDAPNSSTTGGDIWFARDKNNDGVAESIDHFMSIRVNGSEATGMIFNPAKPTEFVVAVQHPESTNLETTLDGLGDAVWQFNLDDDEYRKFVRKLEKASKKDKREDDD